MSLFPRPPLPHTFRAVRHRNYMLLLTGQIISLVGWWMQNTGRDWLVLNMTDNALLLGLVGFAGGIPMLLLGLPAGVVADTVNRHRLIFWAQVLLMLQAFALAGLTLAHGADGKPLITFWQILSLTFLAGIVQSFEMPSRQAFLMDVVPQEDLGNAIALNSLVFNAARVVGPAMAGYLIFRFAKLRPGQAGFGEGMCFLVNALTFLVVLWQLRRMRFERPPMGAARSESRGHLREVFTYLKERPHLIGILIFAGLMALFGIPYLVLLSVFAKDVLKGGSQVFGGLMTSVGVGAIVGGLILARRREVRGLGKVIFVSTVGFSIIITIFAWLRDPWMAYAAIALAGFFMVSAMISATTLVQTLVAEEFRGRMMSLYNIMAVGLFPVGSLIAGAEARSWGAPVAQTANAAICFLSAVGFGFFLPRLRAAAHASEEYQRVINTTAYGADVTR